MLKRTIVVSIFALLIGNLTAKLKINFVTTEMDV